MDREELIKKLHNIAFCAFLTALTSEECLEVEIMTSKGIITSWMGFDDWNIYHISENEVKKLTNVKEKLSKETLNNEDVINTCFDSLSKVSEDGDLNSLFSEFVLSDFKLDSELYCYYDDYTEKYYFFSEERQIAEALDKAYFAVDTEWEDMSTDDLEYWFDRYESYGEIPFCEFEC